MPNGDVNASQFRITTQMDESSAKRSGEAFGRSMGQEAGKRIADAIAAAVGGIGSEGRSGAAGIDRTRGGLVRRASSANMAAGRDGNKQWSQANQQAGAMVGAAQHGNMMSTVGGAAGMAIAGPVGAAVGAAIGDLIDKTVMPALEVRVMVPLKEAMFGIRSTGQETISALQTYSDMVGPALAEMLVGVQAIAKAQGAQEEKMALDVNRRMTDAKIREYSRIMPRAPGEADAAYLDRILRASQAEMSYEYRVEGSHLAAQRELHRRGIGDIREQAYRNDLIYQRRVGERRAAEFGQDLNTLME